MTPSIPRVQAVADHDSLGDLMHERGLLAVPGMVDGTAYLFTLDPEAWPEVDVMAVDTNGDEVSADDVAGGEILWVLLEDPEGSAS